MRLTKIYTKIGDKGTTMLADGSKVAKNSLRIVCYGNIDELNSFVGNLRDLVCEAGTDSLSPLPDYLKSIQNELFDLGGELSTPSKILDTSKQQVVSRSSIERLEKEIDELNADLPPLENFILPGGHRANSAAHMCRTICRRAERGTIDLANASDIREEPQIYLNRLSDWFFVASRYISKHLGVNETIWNQGPKSE